MAFKQVRAYSNEQLAELGVLKEVKKIELPIKDNETKVFVVIGQQGFGKIGKRLTGKEAENLFG